MRLEGDRDRVARYIRARREELGLTQTDVASAGGPSTATQRTLENNGSDGYQRQSLRDEARVLGWEDDALRVIAAGGEPKSRPPGSRQKLASARRASGTPRSAEFPGTGMMLKIYAAMLSKGLDEHGNKDRAEAEARELVASLGLPARDKLEVEEWRFVAAKLGITLGAALHDLLGIPVDDLDLAARPPRPTVRAVPGEGEQRRRALAREGELVNAVAPH